jgi:hypothetical protein
MLEESKEACAKTISTHLSFRSPGLGFALKFGQLLLARQLCLSAGRRGRWANKKPVQFVLSLPQPRPSVCRGRITLKPPHTHRRRSASRASLCSRTDRCTFTPCSLLARSCSSSSLRFAR